MTPELQRNKGRGVNAQHLTLVPLPTSSLLQRSKHHIVRELEYNFCDNEACYTILELQAFAQNIEWNWFIWEKRAELNQKEQIYGPIPVTCSSKHKWKQRLRKTLQIRHAPVFSLEVQTKGLLLSFHQESIFKTTATILFPSAVTWLLIFKKGN